MSLSANEHLQSSLSGATPRCVGLTSSQEELHARMRVAQRAWASLGLETRLSILSRFRSGLVEQAELIAHAANPENRRPISEILASEILPLADAVQFLEREARGILAARSAGWRRRPLWLFGVNSQIHRRAVGLVLIIAPSNYPLFLPGVQLVQALVAGNAVLLKPGPGGLAAALQLLRLLHVAGLPENLVTVLPEDSESAQAAISSGVDKVFFTGSAKIGRLILSQLASRAIPAVMELSGSDAVIVRADADLDLVVRALTFSLRLNGGQTCIAPRRVFVVRSLATELEGWLARSLAELNSLGFSAAQQQLLAPLVQSAITGGAHLLSGEVAADGSLRGPVVLAGVNPQAELLRADVFGPLLSVITVADDAEAILLANSSEPGLGAAIFSADEISAHAIASQLQVGVALINDVVAPTADPRIPFGGRKMSGFGVTRGAEGLLEMTTPQVVIQNHGRRHHHFDAPQPWHERLFLSGIRLMHAPDWRRRMRAIPALISALKSSANHKGDLT